MKQMLSQEYKDLNETLRKEKGDECRFFSFASTIAAKAFNSDRECEGWMGVLYQKEPQQEPSTVWIHVRMNDGTAQSQADALGILGANLVYLVSSKTRSAKNIITHLLDDTPKGSLTLNWVDFSGPGWTDVKNKLVGFWLVHYGLAEAVIFEPEADSGSSFNPFGGGSNSKPRKMKPTVP